MASASCMHSQQHLGMLLMSQESLYWLLLPDLDQDIKQWYRVASTALIHNVLQLLD